MHGVQAWRRSDLALEASLPAVADVASVTPLAAAHGTEVIQVTPGTSAEAKATAMHLFGNANRWLPRRVDRRLPRLAIEPTEAGSAVPRLWLGKELCGDCPGIVTA
jgi:hypothetical protein